MIKKKGTYSNRFLVEYKLHWEHYQLADLSDDNLPYCLIKTYLNQFV